MKEDLVFKSLQWEKPPSGFVKLNIDAGVCHDGGGTVGGLVRGCAEEWQSLFWVDSIPLLIT
ncbi:hypothetical protein G2W53_034126 [Senna tora]|uniref:Uncharacterized protein n=1 Tax=Senna tora TaxID=362788 RepID=A0A834T1Y6_9FABA|nr:hypothetical protein G2W53_034126 [Senna tora]